MILDFSKIEETVIPQFYGGEKEIKAHMKIDKNNKIKIYNDGILILEGETIVEIKELLEALLYGNGDSWEVELLNNILYTINNSLSTNREVA